MRVRFLLAIAAGLLLAASFPKIGIAGFAWLAPGLTLLAAMGCAGRDAFRVGYVAGVSFYLSSLYWLLLIPGKGFQVPGWLALTAYLALYPAAWCWLMAKVSSFPLSLRFSTAGKFQVSSIGNAEKFFVVGNFKKLSASSWAQRTIWSLTGAATWVALEMLAARFFTGFPWLPLGVTQQPILPLTQIASFTGVYGVSFLVVWTSLALVCAAAKIVSRPAVRGIWMGEIILPLLAIVAALTFGFHQLRKSETPSREIKVTFIQPSIPQTMIWDERENENRFRQLIELSERALAETKPDLLLWPEAAVPEMLRYDEETQQAVAELAHKHNVWMILGSDDKEPKKNSADPKAADYFNCGFLVSPDGRLAGRYKKQRLVIFGEYVPLARWLPFVKYFTPITGSYESGDAPVTFEMPPLHAKTSVLICFEDVFPQHTRHYVSSDTDFLVNITNDGWFGESAEQWQHAANASFRAIENGIPLLRCANNGITCWIDSNGRFQKILVSESEGRVPRVPKISGQEQSGRRGTPPSGEEGTVYGSGFMSAKIPLLSEKRAPTFYNRHGDWFGWCCVIFSAALAILKISVRRK